MTSTLPPTTDDTQAQQFLLFDLSEASATLASTPALLPQLSTATPPSATRSSKRSQRSAPTPMAQPTATAPVRLEIVSALLPPEIPPVQLAAIRRALCQALAAQAQAAYEELSATILDDELHHTPAIATERIAAVSCSANHQRPTPPCICSHWRHRSNSNISFTHDEGPVPNGAGPFCIETSAPPLVVLTWPRRRPWSGTSSSSATTSRSFEVSDIVSIRCPADLFSDPFNTSFGAITTISSNARKSSPSGFCLLSYRHVRVLQYAQLHAQCSCISD